MIFDPLPEQFRVPVEEVLGVLLVIEELLLAGTQQGFRKAFQGVLPSLKSALKFQIKKGPETSHNRVG